MLHGFGPHDLTHARRAAAVVALSGALLLLLFTVAVAERSLWTTDLTVVALMVVCGAATLGGSHRLAAVLCLATPVLGVASVTFLDLLTSDATVSGQVFYCLPVLFASTQLMRRGAALVLAAAVAGEALVCFLLLPAEEAAADFAYVALVLTLITVLLVRAGDHQRRLVTALRQQVSIDPLTGLVTRRVLDEAASAALSSSGDASGTSLLLVDVDSFKTVNDTYGHPVGDDALELVGRLLRETSASRDVVARMGGDELALLLLASPYDTALTRAEDVVRLVRGTPLVLPDGREVRLTVSVGVAHSPDDATDVRDLYAAADSALYRAKAAGRNRVGQTPREPVPVLR